LYESATSRLPAASTASPPGEENWPARDPGPPMISRIFQPGAGGSTAGGGAGRSGTTGELLKTYRVFGGIDSGEPFKQYLLAIVVYLVGGGHHTCHEIFSVANLLVGCNGPSGNGAKASIASIVRDAYVPGKYLKHLPASYITTGHFEALREKYYDIAMLGHLHGTFV